MSGDAMWGDALSARRRRWPLLLPPAIALLAFANTIPGDFVFDDAVLIQRGTDVQPFDARRILFSNYWGPDRADRNYRPVVLLSYALNRPVGRLLGGGAGSYHAANVALNALLALVVALLLREIIDDDILAALGACLFAVLPVHTEAVANIVGRAELLAGLGIFGAAALALRASREGGSLDRLSGGGKRRDPRKHRRAAERWGPALAVAALTFLGIGSKEHAAMAPVLLLLAPLALGRRIPWRSFVASSAAIGLYLALRAAALAGKASVVAYHDNPLAFADPFTRALNGLRLLGLYAWKTVFPARLAADYSHAQLPVLPLGSPALWLSALAVLAALTLGIALAWRRWPLVALAVAWLSAAFLPTANVLFPIGTMFGERLAFVPSFAYPLLVCAIALRVQGKPSPLSVGASPLPGGPSPLPGGPSPLPGGPSPLPGGPSPLPGGASPRAAGKAVRADGRWRGRAATVIFCCLIAVYGARTWTRNRDWSSAETMYLRMPADSPRSTRSHQKAAEAYAALAGREPRGPARDTLFEKAREALVRALEIHPENGIAQGTLGEVLLLEGKHAEAEAQLSRAIETMTATRTLQPGAYYLRGQCRLHLGRHREVIEDMDRYIESLARTGARQDFRAWQFHGLARAFQGDLGAALADFSRALSMEGGDVPEVRNNRGMCRFRLEDYEGAIEDWTAALRLAERMNASASAGAGAGASVGGAGAAGADQESSPPRLRAKIAGAWEAVARARRAGGDSAGAAEAEAEAARYRGGGTR